MPRSSPSSAPACRGACAPISPGCSTGSPMPPSSIWRANRSASPARSAWGRASRWCCATWCWRASGSTPGSTARSCRAAAAPAPRCRAAGGRRAMAPLPSTPNLPPTARARCWCWPIPIPQRGWRMSASRWRRATQALRSMSRAARCSGRSPARSASSCPKPGRPGSLSSGSTSIAPASTARWCWARRGFRAISRWQAAGLTARWRCARRAAARPALRSI